MGSCIRPHIISRIWYKTNELFNSYSVGLYKCKDDTKCIARDKVCDGKVHCNKNKDDEKYCHQIGEFCPPQINKRQRLCQRLKGFHWFVSVPITSAVTPTLALQIGSGCRVPVLLIILLYEAIILMICLFNSRYTVQKSVCLFWFNPALHWGQLNCRMDLSIN